ncbi:hypothetical protein WN943_018513 [Citrus x changshan-huyou]
MPRAYYSFWLLLNMYLMAIIFQPHVIHKSRRYNYGRWFDRLFAPIYEDPLILKLINGYQISQTTIIIVKLRDIWGRDKPLMVRVVDHDHTKDDHHAIWNGCLHTRPALGEVYNMWPLYNIYSILSPNTMTTPNSPLLCTVSIKAVRAICLLSEYLGEIL